MNKFLLKLLLIVVCFFTCYYGTAQHHYYAWLRATVNYSITKKIKADAELHYRTQNNIDNKNPFNKNLLTAFRAIFFYKHNEHVQFSFSPLAFFSTNKIIQKDSDVLSPKTTEYRISGYAELQEPLTKKIFLLNRTGIEYRIFQLPSTNITRVRNRVLLRYDASNTFNFSVGDELFVNATGIAAAHIFDQNRILLNAGYKPSSALKFEVGYIYGKRMPKTSFDFFNEESFLFYFTYTIAHK
jgi:hypothetical protein